MKQYLIMRGYMLCFDLCIRRGPIWRVLANLWSRVWYHFFCPYPLDGNWTARSCNQAKPCGCSNADRFRRPVGSSLSPEVKP
jgi:hypothetical protein